MADWTPERLRALDRAVAVAAGWIRPEWADAGLALPEVSLGCRDTFDLQTEFRIEVRRILGGWTAKCWDASCEAASTPQIAICLCWLAAKGVPFNG